MEKEAAPIVLTLGKAGNGSHENEDCARVYPPHGKYLIEVALSDGATEASFSREWARILVSESDWPQLFVRPRKLRNTRRWLQHARSKFDMLTGTASLPWYAKAKAQRGAFATFLAFRLTPELWHAAALGDTCVMQYAGSDLSPRFSFPIDGYWAFSNRPALVPSTHCDTLTAFAFTKRSWSPGDIFVCATDAIAAWLLDPTAQEDNRVHSLIECRDNDDFQTLVNAERAAGRMRNDDSTAIVIRTGEE